MRLDVEAPWKCPFSAACASGDSPVSWPARSLSRQAHRALDVELDEPENKNMWDSEEEAPAVVDTELELEEPDVTVSTWPAEASTPALSKRLAIKLIHGNASARDLARATS